MYQPRHREPIPLARCRTAAWIVVTFLWCIFRVIAQFFHPDWYGDAADAGAAGVAAVAIAGRIAWRVSHQRIADMARQAHERIDDYEHALEVAARNGRPDLMLVSQPAGEPGEAVADVLPLVPRSSAGAGRAGYR